MTKNGRLIDVYVYKRDNGLKFLLLKRAPKKIYAGQWRMIGGKVKQGETSWEGALRELKEETSLIPKSFWSIPTVNHFYNWTSDCIELIPVFAAETDSSQAIQLDEEHTDYKWYSAEEAVQYLNWPEQIRIIELIDELIRKEKILPEWIIPDI